MASRTDAQWQRDLLIGLGLLAGAGVVVFFTSGFVFQALRGPRTITEQELRAVTAPPSGTNYVSFTPSRPAIDTGLQWGRKNNPGTKFLLLPVGDRLLLCSARIANNGPTYTGRLEEIGGGTEREALQRIQASDPGVSPRLMPFMLQAVRSIWFDTAVALAAIVGLAVGGVWLLLRALLRKGARGPSLV